MARTRTASPDCTFCMVQHRIDSHPGLFHPPGQNGDPLSTIAIQKIEIDKRVRLLEYCLADLEEAITLLYQKYHTIAFEKNRYQNRLSAVLGLPPEAHLLIFHHCINNWVLQHGTCWRVSPRRIFTQVCRSWRSLAQSSPDIWCDIEVTEYFSSPFGHLSLANDLVMSKGRPLRISYGYHLQITKFPQILEQLALTRNRWEYFKTDSSLLDFFTLLGQPGPSPKFPLLKSLHGLLISGSERPLHPIDVPSLVHVDLGLKAYKETQPPDLPWSQLHRLSISFPKRYCTIQILTQLNQLRSLDLGLRAVDGDVSLCSKEPIILPLVETLTLFMVDGPAIFMLPPFHDRIRQAIGIVALLHLPALRELSCEGLGNLGLEAITRMLQATRSSFPALPQYGVQRLEVIDLDPDIPQILNTPLLTTLFQCLPHLKELSTKRLQVDCGASPEDLLNVLTSTPAVGQATPCPALEKVSFTERGFEVHKLERFITSRLESEKLLGKRILTGLVLRGTCNFMSGYSRNDVKVLMGALDAFVQRPGTSLSVDLGVMAKLDGVEASYRVLCPAGS